MLPFCGNRSSLPSKPVIFAVMKLDSDGEGLATNAFTDEILSAYGVKTIWIECVSDIKDVLRAAYVAGDTTTTSALAQEWDELWAAQAVEMDPDKRIEIFHEISRIMNEKVYWLGVWHDPDPFSLNRRTRNVRLSGADPFWNCYEWDVAP